ncbi:conserved hypothetical protein [Sphingomonas sp. T1]|jgi:hypothetical protein|uniref:hypothetical protein n=1 Tax=unclassified Sphingomonas TaxID=196159 RepID=UPI0006F4881E|nr:MULTISPECIES: hypothetical protein [unclassified Sphingomonas]KQN20881.1 hypothetical protein ASE89_15575 [Sphingomonas sp. Leaf30]MBD8550378.1 hypothetical protein [Sphingomonas sp. CFBP 8764]VXC82679.1 conserved hypothetical protein [Sphingomonas sp. T1]
MENIASPLDLLTSLKIAFVERDEAADAFDVFKQDAIMAHEPSPADAPAISSDDAADAAAGEVDAFDAEVRGLLAAASDADVIGAYRATEGEVGDPAAEALLGEIRRRQLTA